MKVLNNEEIKALAVDIFNRYPKANKVAVTSDGQVFITDESDNAAKNHAARNRYGKELHISDFTRGGLESKQVTSLTAEDLIGQIKEATTVEAVESIRLVEESGKKRTTVLAAADTKIKELKAE